MVLRPILVSEPAADTGFVGAWAAVERQQKKSASRWLLITQPDHADLSGQIAAAIDARDFPAPPAEVVNAIRNHDSGWSALEGAGHFPPALHPDGRPVSFFEIAPEQFLEAWDASVERAAENSAVGGYIVSRHFSSLGESRLERAPDPPETQAKLRGFVDGERSRQGALRKLASDVKQWESYVLLLQFCDLLSLYLCCGAPDAVEFPQCSPAGRIRATRSGRVVSLSPTPLRSSLQLQVRGWHWPSATAESLPVEFSLR
ncbi:MAG: DUF3891 family protein [Terriglobales bacterium]